MPSKNWVDCKVTWVASIGAQYTLKHSRTSCVVGRVANLSFSTGLGCLVGSQMAATGQHRGSGGGDSIFDGPCYQLTRQRRKGRKSLNYPICDQKWSWAKTMTSSQSWEASWLPQHRSARVVLAQQGAGSQQPCLCNIKTVHVFGTVSLWLANNPW